MRAGKLVHTRNMSEAHRIVRELSGVTQGVTPLALKTSSGGLVFGPATVPPTAEYFLQRGVLPPVPLRDAAQVLEVALDLYPVGAHLDPGGAVVITADAGWSPWVAAVGGVTTTPIVLS